VFTQPVANRPNRKINAENIYFCSFNTVNSKAKLKYFSSLHERKQRQTSGLFLVEGHKAVFEALKSGLFAEAILCTSPYLQRFNNEVVSIDYQEISVNDLQKISGLKTPEGILGVFHIPVFSSEIILPAICLESVQDPGNVGTIIRIADWFGIPTVLCTPETADPWQVKVVRSSMASLARVRVQVRKDFYEIIRQSNEPVLVADMKGQDISDFVFPEKWMLVLGNEGKGISDLLKAEKRITYLNIPGAGGAESLNVGVATGIMAFQYFHQFHK